MVRTKRIEMGDGSTGKGTGKRNLDKERTKRIERGRERGRGRGRGREQERGRSFAALRMTEGDAQYDWGSAD